MSSRGALVHGHALLDAILISIPQKKTANVYLSAGWIKNKHSLPDTADLKKKFGLLKPNCFYAKEFLFLLSATLFLTTDIRCFDIHHSG